MYLAGPQSTYLTGHRDAHPDGFKTTAADIEHAPRGSQHPAAIQSPET
jgi:hypothetical protein